MNTYDPQRGSNRSSKKTVQIIAILIGIALIIAARTIQSKTAAVQIPGGVVEASVEGLKPISAADHTRGSIDAPIKLIEYSDLECPFCKIFHQSMLEISPDFIDSGKLLWVYRHYPLTSIHANAKDMSVATECVGKLGGNDAFWKMIDGIFADPDQKFDVNKLPILARAAGVNVPRYSACFRSKETLPIVEGDMADGEKIGIMGTPYAVIISPKGKTFPIMRAYSSSELREILGAIATQ